MTEKTYSISLTRIFRAPREAVFRAWTDPELIKDWMLRGQLKEVEMDATEGGAYRLTAEMPYGLSVAFGSFREIRAPEKLVFTFSWEQIPIGETIITVVLLEHEDGTEMRFTQELFPDEGTASVHEAVWPKDFDLLDELLVKGLAS